MYTMHKIFCATAWELEEERRAFHDVIGQFNETEAMKRSVLYIPVTLVNIRDKRPFQHIVDENIRQCRYYVLVLSGGWGPPERNFEHDYRLAREGVADPALPMLEVAFLWKTGAAPAEGLPVPDSEFST